MRSIAKGSDGWYFENVKIEPTEEEIAAWNNLWCDHCSMGSIMPNKGTLKEQRDRQVPCPVCMGTGRKDFTKYFRHATNGKVVSVDKEKLNPDTLQRSRRITVEFDWGYPSQQDGRPLHPAYERVLKMLHLGRTVLEALDEKK
jgi:hypothetical protein